MMNEKELSDFFAHIDEISQDSSSLDHFQLLQKYRNENNRLVQTLTKIRESTKGLLDILKEERRAKLEALHKIAQSNADRELLQTKYEDLERLSVNNEFSHKEKIDELELQRQCLIEDQQELAKDYFDVLEEATLFYNFEIKRERTKIINKTSNFLKGLFGSKFKKPKLKIKKCNEETISKVSKRSRNAKTESISLIESVRKSKRRRVDVFEMQSISEASSPASFYDEGADMGEDDSTFTYNTFSIGNETSYSLLQSKRISAHSQTISQCKCYIDPEETDLVSIGINTDLKEFDKLPNVPSLIDDDLIFDEGELVNSTINRTTNETDLDLSEPENEIMEKILTKNEILNDDVSTLPVLSTPTKREMKDQSTNCDRHIVARSDKSTLTTRSLTHRGTMTPSVVTKNFGMQFPDINFDKIIEEMEFEVPDCLSPIKDIEKVTQQTQTDLQNVNRELFSNEVTKNSINCEDQSFINLGRSIFNIFLNRLRENNMEENDDERTREKLWQFLRKQYLDRFDEITFDEYFSASFISDSGSICSQIIENNNVIKKVKNLKEIEDTSECSQKSSESSKNPGNVYEELAVSSSTSSDKEFEQLKINNARLSPIQEISEIDIVDENINELEEILKNVKMLETVPRQIISPVLDFEEFMWSTIFPSAEQNISLEESPEDDEQVLKGFDVDHEPIEIPMEYLESPNEPPSIANQSYTPYEPKIIPLQNLIRQNLDCENSIITYNRLLRQKLVSWQKAHTIFLKTGNKILCKVRKIINIYLESDWTDKNLESCVVKLKNRKENILLEAIYETVEDNFGEKEINTEFTPPAPPLPRYQQKLILLINKLAEINPKLPHRLIVDLEIKLFKLDAASTSTLDHLRNMSYYYTALLDLFFEGNSTMALYFIVKCIYFYGYRAIPMVFVIIKAFPSALPKKSLLIKKYNDAADWENLTGLEMSKIRLDLKWIDSLDLCIMYLLTNIQMYRRKGNEFKAIYEHELFNYFPKYYGFALNFLSAQKLIEILMKRIDEGELKNMSLALILLGKRMSLDTTIRILVKGYLLPLLNKYVTENIHLDIIDQTVVNKISLIIEVISSILKPLHEEKDRSFKEIFPLIVNILGRTNNQQIQECCIKAILRLQRFIQNHKEIYEIVKNHYDNGKSFSDTLRHMILTFIHRKNEVYFKN